jgi:hypothetical protein
MSWGVWHWLLFWIDMQLFFILWFHHALGPQDDGDNDD